MPVLLGRTSELGAIRAALDDVHRQGAALVLRGDPGIGKSMVLDAARDAAAERGFRTLAITGVETEAALPYAGLQRLLAPLGDAHRAALPAPQRAVLDAAFGVTDDEDDAGAADMFLVALAALGLLAAAAAEHPLLVVVDDLHWLDAVSRDAITFVGRRIESDPIILLAAVRDGHDERTGPLNLPERTIGGLDLETASALLDATAPALAAPLRQRVLREAAGNPLALTELPATAARVADASGGDGPVVPISARLEQAFAHRMQEAGPDTRSLLLTFAADVTSPLAEVLAAGEIVLGRPITVAALQPAFDAALLSLDGTGLAFRHPLVRSAVYQAAPIELRHRAHAALAEVVADQPDRRALHRAAAATGPDAGVAQDLEELGVRALRRGAALQASAALARAAELSTADGDRARRLLAAAEPAFEAGRADLVRTLVEQARTLPLGARDQDRAEWLSEIFHDGAGPGQGDAARVLHLVDLALRADAVDDPEGALALIMAAALRTWWGDSDHHVREEVVAALDRLSGPPTDPRRIAALAMAQPIVATGRVQELVAGADASGRVDPRSVFLLGMASHAIGDDAAALRLLTVAGDGLREQGRLALLAQALVMRSVDSVPVGDWGAAHPAAFEARRLAEETGQPIWRSGATGTLAALAALHGDLDAADRLAAEAVAISDAAATTAVLGWLHIVRAIVHLAAGRYDEAYARVARIFDPDDPSHHLSDQFMGVTFLADAAVGCDRVREARVITQHLEALAGTPEVVRVRWGLRYARALLADEDAAPAQFRAALAAPWSAKPFVRARLQLAHGMWLRRHREIVASREPLRLARAGFDALDAAPWGERARGELRAAGEVSDARRRQAWDDLSPQELQIAQLAAAGMSNREIGQRLYLSHRTVASHLYRAFPKLGITSRSQLNAVLPAQAPEARA
jgi:DNA-binding CsgD family transcriptional regulator